MGDRNGYTGKVSGVVLSFADETFISWRDCYIPKFWRIIVIGELVVELLDFVKCMELLINAIVFGYQLRINLEYVVKLLTFVNEKFCSGMLVTCSLVRIDVV